MPYKPDPSGATVSVIDRLVDEAPENTHEPRPLRVVGIRRLRESVRRELVRLLNTRSGVAWDAWLERPRTVLDYGIPDFTWMSPGSHGDRERLAAMVARCVEIFEPRLHGVRVQALPSDSSRSVRLVIDARLVIESVNELVSFPIAVKESGEMYLEDADD